MNQGTPPVTDYFPTTAGSFWDYGKQGGAKTDSIRIAVSSKTKNIGNNTYTVFTQDSIPASGFPDSLFYRKGSGKYYENFNIGDYVGLDPGTTPM